MLTPELLSLYFYLVDKLYQKQLSIDLDFTGLERYFIILWLIEEGNEMLSQQNLADLLKTDKAAIVRILNYLEKKGFVERLPHPTDQRSYQLRLARKAKKHFASIQEGIQGINEQATLGFSEQEKQQFFSLLAKMYQNLAPNPVTDFLVNFEKKTQQVTLLTTPLEEKI
jgi:DNA-binding MarR family transcriptional regulator